jgi:hypothetical protein
MVLFSSSRYMTGYDLDETTAIQIVSNLFFFTLKQTISKFHPLTKKINLKYHMKMYPCEICQDINHISWRTAALGTVSPFFQSKLKYSNSLSLMNS